MLGILIYAIIKWLVVAAIIWLVVRAMCKCSRRFRSFMARPKPKMMYTFDKPESSGIRQ